MVSDATPNVLLVGPARGRLEDVCKLLQQKGLPTNRADLDDPPTRPMLRAVDLLVCLLEPQDTDGGTERLRTLLARARSENLTALVWGAPDNFEPPEGLSVECLPPDIGLDELLGRLTTLARYAPVVKRMEKELQRLQRLGRHLNRYFDEIDQELRLAGRLQNDFLPHALPQVGPLRFGQLYRPAGWVSGDIFDVFAIDPRNVGVFIADAMGHGTAAGLMTMLLRRTLVPMRLHGKSVRVLQPAEVMGQLHDGLARHDLPHAQFVTAAYAIINPQSLEVRLARGGHPYPLHVNAAGEIRELCSEGGLLGVAGLEPYFEERRVQLAPGDKLVFYTDGLEELFIAGRDEQTGQAEYGAALRDWARLDADGFVTTIGEYLDHQAGSLNPEDDITVVVAQVAR